MQMIKIYCSRRNNIKNAKKYQWHFCWMVAF